MIYLVLNIILAVICVLLSIYVDAHTGNQADSPLIPILLVLASCAGGCALCLLISPVAPLRLMTFLGRLYLLDMSLFSVMLSSYCVNFPKYQTPKMHKIVSTILMLIAAFVIFQKIDSFTITKYSGIFIESAPLFKGELGEVLHWSWYNAFFFLMGILVPGFSVLMMLVKSEYATSKIDRQKMYLTAAGVALSWLMCLLLELGSYHVPMFNTLITFSFVITLLTAIQAATHNMLYDFDFLLEAGARFVLRYFFTSALGGVLFAAFYPLARSYGVEFLVIEIIFTIAILVVSHQIFKLFGRRSQYRDSKYSQNFEDDIANLDFNTEPENIIKELYDIFNKNLRTSSLSIMVDNNQGELELSYSTEPLPEEERYSISINSPMLDTLWNTKQRVIFKINAESQYIYEPIRKDLLTFFERTKSEAFIVLHEGRRIIGIILLGAKKDANIYDDIDFAMFNKLYSYFFVVGFYMRNIVNENVVGTVGREIRMSEQIITSIQENIDEVENPKADVGYLMIPAHSIGGEFIELIKLDNERHIFIIGSLSGKGISASMSMVILKSIIRTYLVETSDFKILVQKVNHFIREHLPLGTFFAGVFALMDFSSDTLYYVNCGTPALFMYNRTYNNIIEIQGDGRVLGFVQDVSSLVKVKKIKLSKGDTILACTGGLINSTSLRGEIFGKERVQRLLMENMTFPANRIAQFTYDALVKFASKELSDDVSIIVMKYLGDR